VRKKDEGKAEIRKGRGGERERGRKKTQDTLVHRSFSEGGGRRTQGRS